MDLRVNERWLRLPRVVLLYIPLYTVAAMPMFNSDPDNPARAFSFALMWWTGLTAAFAVVAIVVVGDVIYLRKNT